MSSQPTALPRCVWGRLTTLKKPGTQKAELHAGLATTCDMLYSHHINGQSIRMSSETFTWRIELSESSLPRRKHTTTIHAVSYRSSYWQGWQFEYMNILLPGCFTCFVPFPKAMTALVKLLKLCASLGSSRTETESGSVPPGRTEGGQQLSHKIIYYFKSQINRK